MTESIRLWLIYLTITLGTSFQFGYQTGVINAPLTHLEAFINETTISRHGTSDYQLVLLIKSFCVSAFLLGGLIGGLATGLLSKRIGRRRSLFYLALPTALGSLFMGFSSLAGSFEMVIIGRFLIGLSCGAYTVLTPLYLTELAPLALRGSAGVTNQLVIVSAILFAQIIGLPELLGNATRWPLALGLGIIPCLLSTLGLFFIPESPRYLYHVTKDQQAARAVLNSLRDDPQLVDEEIDALAAEKPEEGATKIPFSSLFRSKHLRMALLIALMAQVGQQLSGINCILYYFVDLLTAIDLTQRQASYANIGVGVSIVFITIVSLFIIERVGRRSLFLGGLLVMFISLCIYTVMLIISHALVQKWPVYIAVVLIYISVCGFGIGPGSIPWFLAAEMFTQEYRDMVTSLAVFTNWVCNIFVSLVFPHLLESMNIYAFIPFIVVLLLTIIFMTFHLPETKGRNPVEVAEDLRQRYGHRVAASDGVTNQAFLETTTNTGITA